MLRGLSQATRAQIASRAAQAVRPSRQEASQLALDIVFYKWAREINGVTADIRNVDLIIPALSKELKDPTVTWAVRYFSSEPESKENSAVPPRDDDRVQSLLDLKTRYRSAMDYRTSSPVQAVSALQAALALCQQLHLDLGESLVLKHMGDHYLYDMARYALAEACYERPAWTFPPYRCWAAAAAVYDDFAYLNAETGRYATATEYYVEAARNWEQLASTDPTRYRYLAGREYLKAGIAAGDYTKALELMRNKGLGHLRAWAVATKSYDVLIRSLMEVADYCQGAGDTSASLDLLKQAQQASALQNDPLLTAKVLDALGKTYSALKQPQNQAAAAAKRAQVLKSAAANGTAALDKLEKETRLARDIETNLLLSAERGASACQELRNYARSIDAWRRTAQAYRKRRDVEGQIRCLRALGAVLDIADKPTESLEARREAVMLARSMKQSTLAASIVQEMIQSFRALNDLNNALEGFKELAPIVEEAGNMRGVAQVLEERGSLLAKHDLSEDAIPDLDEARKRYVNQVGDIWSGARVALLLAEVRSKAGKSDEARATLESAVGEIESSFGYESFGASAPEERLSTLKGLYGALLKSYVHAGSLDLATDLVRKGRRHAWFGKLVIDLRSDGSNPALSGWAKTVDVTLIAEPDTASQGPGERLLARDWASFAEACFRLERQHPREYGALPINPLEVLKRRSGLPEGLLVLAYLKVESSVYAFVCGRDRAICRQITGQKGSVDALVNRLRRVLRTCEESLAAGIPIPRMATWREAAFVEISEPLAGLYGRLVAPLAGDLSGARRLAFALPDELSGLPMHALISSKPESDPEFLVEDFEISYLGAGMLDDLVGPESRPIDPSSDWLAVFADPEENLPGARDESAAIRSAYSMSRAYVGRDAATAANFIAECKRANLIHVAAHHRMDASPAGIQLLLARDSTSDGTVTLRALSAVQNPYLQLVVLSACDAIGSSDPISQGPARTAEVFSLIGAKSVLGGLWKVSDKSAQVVMAAFYQGLSRGKSRAEALQSAQRAVIESKQFAHPFYWACFALYGNPR
jgi:tetratricopeptide (TPR) repeat protein